MIEVKDEEYILRRIVIHPSHIKEDGSISSAAFRLNKNDIDGLSINIKHLTTYQLTVVNSKKYRVAELKAAIPRSLELDVIHDPVEGNDAHGLITGSITKSKSRQLSRNAVFIEPY